jgi:diphosphomevalonate decarboxylase
MGSHTWKSPSNIALVKYWGKYPVQIPANPSISFTLSEAATTTTLSYTSGTGEIPVYRDGVLTPAFLPKIQTFFERTEAIFPFWKEWDFEIRTSNSFPHSSGIASSASGMSALSLCLMSMKESLGLPIGNFFEEASEAARLGSGSGSRSVFGPLAAWGTHDQTPGSNDRFAVAYSAIHECFHEFQDTILLVDKGEKTVSSTVGHDLMLDHPYAQERFKQAHHNQSALLQALKEGDLQKFGAIVESEALTLHAMMMTSMPYFILMKPNTLKVLEAVWAFRKETGNPLYFTLDAGANVHLLYPKSHKDVILQFIETELRTFCKDGSYLCDHVGMGPIKL